MTSSYWHIQDSPHQLPGRARCAVATACISFIVLARLAFVLLSLLDMVLALLVLLIYLARSCCSGTAALMSIVLSGVAYEFAR